MRKGILIRMCITGGAAAGHGFIGFRLGEARRVSGYRLNAHQIGRRKIAARCAQKSIPACGDKRQQSDQP